MADLGSASVAAGPAVSRERLARSSVWSLTGWVGSMLISFVSAPIQIGLLGAGQYGLYTLLASIIAPMILLDFGMGEATVKYVAESIGAGDRAGAGRYLRSTLAFNLLVGAIGATAIILLADVLTERVFNIPEESTDIARACLYWIGATWFLSQTRGTFIGAVTALQRYDIVNAISLFSQLLTTGAGLTVLALGGGVRGLIEAQAGATLVLTLGWIVMSKRLYPGVRLFPTIDRSAFRKTFGYGFWQMLNNLGGLLANQSQRWLLGILLPVATVGYYGVGLALPGTSYMIANRVGQVVFPAASHLQGEGRDDRAARLLIQASWLASIAASSVLVPLAVLAPDVLRLWIGEEFARNSSAVMRVLCLASAVGAVFAVPNFYLLGTGRAKWLAILAFTMGVVSLPLALVLIPRMGVVGAALAYASAHACHLSVIVVLWIRVVRRWIGGPTYFSALFGHLAVACLVAGSLVYLRSFFPARPGWLLLIAAGSGIAILYVIVALLFEGFLPGGKARRASLPRLVADRYPTMRFLRHLGGPP